MMSMVMVSGHEYFRDKVQTCQRHEVGAGKCSYQLYPAWIIKLALQYR